MILLGRALLDLFSWWACLQLICSPLPIPYAMLTKSCRLQSSQVIATSLVLPVSLLINTSTWLSPRLLRNSESRYVFGNTALHCLTFPMKSTSLFLSVSAASTDAKYASAATRQLLPCHVLVSSSRTLVPFPYVASSGSRSRSFLIAFSLLVPSQLSGKSRCQRKHQQGFVSCHCCWACNPLRRSVEGRCWYMVATVPIPRDHWLVGFKLYTRIKSLCAVGIEVGDEIINQHLPIPLRRYFRRLIRQLTGPSDGVPDVFPAIARHPRCQETSMRDTANKHSLELCASIVHVFLDGCSKWYVSVVFLAGQVLSNWYA